MKTNYKKTLFFVNEIKNKIQTLLSTELNLLNINGPLILEKSIQLNDNLVLDQNAVSFYSKPLNKEIEIVQSLAKWKRFALKKYGFLENEGIIVDMKAIRAHELPDYSHSIFVDQWDWELVINPNKRNIHTLKDVVKKIYKCIVNVQQYLFSINNSLKYVLPNEITFFDSQALEDTYPEKSFEDIVELIAKKHKAVFIIGIGKKLKSGRVFDLRSHEYDDWDLNGDIVFWSDVLNHSIEISSMGIRVNKDSLLKQSGTSFGDVSKSNNKYYNLIINNELNQTIGGGIGQSRLFMFLLEKSHIAEVQPSIWSTNDEEQLIKENKEIM